MSLITTLYVILSGSNLRFSGMDNGNPNGPRFQPS